MKDAGHVADIPDNPAPYLTEWLFDIGPSVPAGSGMGRIEYRDLVAWQEISGVELEPWEARIIRRLSSEYLSQLSDAEKPDCPAPWTSNIEMNRSAVASKVAAVFGGRARKG